jgi:hypothetical protein
MAKPEAGDLHRHGRAVDQHDLVAPVELAGLARGEAQRHEGGRRRRRLFPVPAPRVAPNGVMAALMTEPAQLLEHAHRRQPLARRLRRVGRQDPLEIRPPGADPRQRLDLPRVLERGRPGARHHRALPDPSERCQRS